MTDYKEIWFNGDAGEELGLLEERYHTCINDMEEARDELQFAEKIFRDLKQGIVTPADSYTGWSEAYLSFKNHGGHTISASNE